MILGIGCDIILIHRFEKWIVRDALLKRYFDESELAHIQGISMKDRLRSIAGKFAAKEAYMKSVQNTQIRLKDIVIEQKTNGAPQLTLKRTALIVFNSKKAQKSFLSISHDGDYAMATVVIET